MPRPAVEFSSSLQTFGDIVTYDVIDAKRRVRPERVIPEHSVCQRISGGFADFRLFHARTSMARGGYVRLANFSNKSLGEISATRRSAAILSSRELNDRRSLARYLAEREQLLRSTFLFFCGRAHVRAIRFAWF